MSVYVYVLMKSKTSMKDIKKKLKRENTWRQFLFFLKYQMRICAHINLSQFINKI